MLRKRSVLLVQVLSFLLVTLLGIATGALTRDAGVLPWGLEVLRRGSLPLAGVIMVLIIGLMIWQHVTEERLALPAGPIWDSDRSRLVRVLFIGDDWAQDHHDIEIEGQDGRRLTRARLPEGIDGITRLHALVAEHAPPGWVELTPEQAAGQVVMGIETDRGPWVRALRAAGYEVFAINPLSAARYRSAALHLRCQKRRRRGSCAGGDCAPRPRSSPPGRRRQ
jgi:hypothetical protein